MPHSTHLLQPLDVGIFGPLAHYYSQLLEETLSSLPLARGISKADFWLLFSQAWEKIITPKNITSVFQTAGIYPYSLPKVIEKLPEKSPNLELQNTPMV